MTAPARRQSDGTMAGQPLPLHQRGHAFQHHGLAYPPGTIQRQQYQDLYQPLNLAGILGPSTNDFWHSSFGQKQDGFDPDPLKLAPTSNPYRNQAPMTAEMDSSTSTSACHPSMLSPVQNWEQNLPLGSSISPTNLTFTGNQVGETRNANERNFEYTSPPEDQTPLATSSQNDWAQHIVSGVTDLAHVLSTTGQFLFLSASAYDLTGYRPEELIGRKIVDFIHSEDIDTFAQQFHSAVHYGTDLAMFYRFRKRDGRYLILEAAGHAKFADNTPESAAVQNLLRTPHNLGCLCFFGSARPYPSHAAAALDSFIDLAVENQGLQTHVRNLQQQMHNEGDFNIYSGESSSAESFGDGQKEYSDYAMANLRDAYTTSAMLPPVASSHRQIPKARLPNTLASSRAPLPPIDPDKKKTKNRRGVEKGAFVCQDCGISESPEWRKGPSGPKTLCNACGLRYAKRMKAGPNKPTKSSNKHK